MHKRNTFLAFIFFVIIIPKVTTAHAILEYSEPAHRSQLYRAPDRIVLTFNEEIEESFSKITVLDEMENIITLGERPERMKDKKSITIDLPSINNGIYFVQFEVISVDGHKVKGRYKFTIKDIEKSQ